MLSIRPVSAAGLIVLLCGLPGFAFAEVAAPSSALSPTDVVRAQLTALRADDPAAGARLALRLACQSSGHRQRRGFRRRAAAGLYRHVPQARARIRLQRRDGDRARVLAELEQADGRQSAYVFFLSRQTDDDCDGCWLTGGVYPLESGNNAPLYSIQA